MRYPLRLAWLLWAATIVAAPATGQPASGRPNVVIILVDDMGWSDIGPYGSEISTPHLDALAAGGVRFTQFYVTPRCSPSRASLLTGLYPHQAGMGHLDNIIREGSSGTTGRLNDRSVTIAEVLHGHGGQVASRPAEWLAAVAARFRSGPEHSSRGHLLSQPEFSGRR
jgi:arylsulfatase